MMLIAPVMERSSTFSQVTMNWSPPEFRLALHVSFDWMMKGSDTPYTPPARIPGPKLKQFLAAVLAKKMNFTLFTVHPSPLNDTRTSTSMAPYVS